MLEEQAARLAARNITSKDVGAIEKIAVSLESAVVERRTKDVAELQRRLHFTIYKAAKRSHLLRLIEDLWDLSARYTGPSSQPVSDEWSRERYVIRSIVSACKLRDANALGLMIRYKVHRDSIRPLEPAHCIESGSPERSTVSRKETKRDDVKARRSRRA
jgi:DNA-binding GntR family transcriptional regulator